MSGETNGLYLGKHYIPKELLTLILSHVPPIDLPRLALVCEEWNSIIKGNLVWMKICKQTYPSNKIKILPWYVYYTLLCTEFFDTNLIKKHDWKSPHVWEFHKGPFKIKSWQYGCIKIEGEYFINLKARKVYTKILRKYKPNIVIETPTDIKRVDIVMIGTKTGIKSHSGDNLKIINETNFKVDYLIDDYPEDIEQIGVFVEVESDRVCSLKILFDSIQPLEEVNE